MVTVLLYIFLLLVVIVVFGSAAYAGLQAAPWVPVYKRDILRIIKLADVQPGEFVIDLGSGDGRVLIALANSAEPKVLCGFEISMLLYVWSKIRLKYLGLSGKAEVRYGNFLKRDLGQANVIFCFLTPMAMKKLAPKFKKELKKGTRIVSYAFSLPGWSPAEMNKPEEKDMPIYKYIVD